MRRAPVIENRAARHNYFIEDTIECGIELKGHEVKSVRNGMASIKESWVNVENGQLIIKRMHITKWDKANTFDVDLVRDRKLLVHRYELRRLGDIIQRDGLTLIPLKVYFNENGKCKVEVGVCKGKKLYDKRESAKKADANRNIQRVKNGMLGF